MKKLCLATLAMLLTACVSQSQLYMTPSRQVMRCWASGTGLVGMAASGISMNNCDTDFRTLGYLPIEEAGATGLALMGDPTSKNIIVQKVAPNSPASNAGITVGDVVVAINGQKPVNAVEAVKSMFGRVGDEVSITISGSPAPRTYQLIQVPYLSLYGALPQAKPQQPN